MAAAYGRGLTPATTTAVILVAQHIERIGTG
jgi:hypothetical protein